MLSSEYLRELQTLADQMRTRSRSAFFCRGRKSKSGALRALRKELDPLLHNRWERGILDEFKFADFVQLSTLLRHFWDLPSEDRIATASQLVAEFDPAEDSLRFTSVSMLAQRLEVMKNLEFDLSDVYVILDWPSMLKGADSAVKQIERLGIPADRINTQGSPTRASSQSQQTDLDLSFSELDSKGRKTPGNRVGIQWYFLVYLLFLTRLEFVGSDGDSSAQGSLLSDMSIFLD